VLAWVALVPLLRIAVAGERTRTIAATIAYALILGQADVTPWLVPAIGRYFALGPAAAAAVGVGGMGVLAAAYGALLAVALVARRRARPRLGIVWCAATWSLWEWLRTVVPPFLASCTFAVSQVDVLPLLQLASVAGIAAVTALVVAGNAALADLADERLARSRRIVDLAAVAALVGVVVAWGSWRVSANTGGGSVAATSVVLIDGAARTAADSTLARYVATTPRPLDPLTSVVIWPESALDIDFTHDRAAWSELARFVETLGVPLVTGGVGTVLGDDGELVRFNAVHFVRPHHGMQSYYKRWLVPLAESWPVWLGGPPTVLAPVAAGRNLVLFGEGLWRFGVLICSEITDSAAARRLAALGARFVVSVNNDVWFGDRAPHAVWARVRAVESGLPVVRAANRGTNAVIDPFGRLVAAHPASEVPGFLAATVPEPVATVYGRSGEVFLPTCLAIVLAGFRRRRSA
jgi:apolipoprotein N-acyltransferase